MLYLEYVDCKDGGDGVGEEVLGIPEQCHRHSTKVGHHCRFLLRRRVTNSNIDCDNWNYLKNERIVIQSEVFSLKQKILF